MRIATGPSGTLHHKEIPPSESRGPNQQTNQHAALQDEIYSVRGFPDIERRVMVETLQQGAHMQRALRTPEDT
ncbi:hypothetical protein EYF80_058833 [Liparis tanakae]|uniref:Uncharacterized protein n=1 Tax=Liparis tanakae TaxID=230148 RepID=A0A4Z2EQ26_9TELE|nr:hypothetical protein EYF80_058833 [Liparis tanakae]